MKIISQESEFMCRMRKKDKWQLKEMLLEFTTNL